MRSAKETEFFPYTSNTLCYIEVGKDGNVNQVHCAKEDMISAYKKIVSGTAILYAVWPGKYRSDLFIIDDPHALANAFCIEPQEQHIHEIKYRMSDIDDGKSMYANIDLEFKCGCKLDSSNIKRIANDLNKQLGWVMATSTGFGSHYDVITGRVEYSVRIRRSSIKEK